MMLRSLYPFGMRRYRPYRIWLEEVERAIRRRWPRAGQVQGSLFDDAAESGEGLQR